MDADQEERLRDASGTSLELLTALRFAVRNWYWIVAGAVIAGGVMFGISFLMPKVYEAEVTALPVKEQQGIPSLRSLVGGYGAIASLAGVSLPGSENPAEMAIVRLKSRGFMEEFIREQELLPELFPDKWNAESHSWRSEAGPSPTSQDGYLLMAHTLVRASVDKRAGTVAIKVRWTDPVKAANWANLLVDRVNRVTRESAITEASTSVKFLMEELESAKSVELRSSIGMLLEEQVNRRMVAETRPDYALKVIDAARPSDTNRFVSPRRFVMILGGALGGALLGALLAFLYGTPASSRGILSRLDR